MDNDKEIITSLTSEALSQEASTSWLIDTLFSAHPLPDHMLEKWHTFYKTFFQDLLY